MKRRKIESAKPSGSHSALSFDQANAICRGFVPIAEGVFEHMDQLRDAGFEAFVPRHEFIESFAETPEELEIHRQCLVEGAKERLGRPMPIRMSDDQFKRIYFSPFLQRLREERDRANGMPVLQLRTCYRGAESVWRAEVNPCERRWIQAKFGQQDTYEPRWIAMMEQERRALQEEAEQHASGLGKVPHTFDQRGRYVFFSAVMGRDAAPLGFHYDKSRSSPCYPVFSKAINGDWDLCWAIEEPQMFFYSPFEGNFEPNLGLRSKRLRGTLAKSNPGEFLNIRYTTVVPGFGNGYRTFFDLDGLETCIKAHLHLYGLMGSIIENALSEVLGGAPV